jgi:hypothetical protein
MAEAFAEYGHFPLPFTKSPCNLPFPDIFITVVGTVTYCRKFASGVTAKREDLRHQNLKTNL